MGLVAKVPIGFDAPGSDKQYGWDGALPSRRLRFSHSGIWGASRHLGLIGLAGTAVGLDWDTQHARCGPSRAGVHASGSRRATVRHCSDHWRGSHPGYEPNNRQRDGRLDGLHRNESLALSRADKALKRTSL
jgi:hypothetical protein